MNLDFVRFFISWTRSELSSRPVVYFLSLSLSVFSLRNLCASTVCSLFSLLPCSSFFLLPISLDLYFFSPVHPFLFGNSLSSLPLDPRPRDGFKLALLEFASQQIVLACGTCLCEAPSCCCRSIGVSLKGPPLDRGCRN